MVNYLVESIIFAGKKIRIVKSSLFLLLLILLLLLLLNFAFEGTDIKMAVLQAISHFFPIYLFSQGMFLVFWIRTTFSTHEYSLQIFAAAPAVIKRRSSLGRSTSGSERHTDKKHLCFGCAYMIPTISLKFIIKIFQNV